MRDKRQIAVLLLLALATVPSAALAEAAALNDQVLGILHSAGWALLSLGAIGGATRALTRFQAGEVTNGRELLVLGTDVLVGICTGTVVYTAADAMADDVLAPQWLPLCTLIGAYFGAYTLEKWLRPLIDRAVASRTGQ